MTTTHNLGFPRIGHQRELKFALERYWRSEIDEAALRQTALELRQRQARLQSRLDWTPVGDFSLYDQVLDMSFLLGCVPQRATAEGGSELDAYFRVARGRAPGDDVCCGGVHAGEMTKWFDTNYHYIVPELSADSRFSLQPERLIEQIREARARGQAFKPVIIGPLTWLWLGKTVDGSSRLALLPRLLPVYRELLQRLADEAVQWLQIDEPILVTELSPDWQQAFRDAYEALRGAGPRRLLTTYFGRLGDNLELACSLPVDGLHLDCSRAREEVEPVIDRLPEDRILSLGIIDGRNIWKTDLTATLDFLEPIRQRIGKRLWIAPSCSLLHVPVDLQAETALDPEIRDWLAFAVQKLDELDCLAEALRYGREHVEGRLEDNARALERRRNSPRVRNPGVRQRLQALGDDPGRRGSAYAARAAVQRQSLRLPLFPTTTIGSFPQTLEIRQQRRDFRQGRIDEAAYRSFMQDEIARCIAEQERLGLDVLVHGEAERNDMVEYFGEQLDGYTFTGNGWVQSYGSRCVKPPIIVGDISRPRPMTVDWITHAQSLTDKPVKGMLTGPVTMLNWSFVRDDQPRSETCLQLALAIRDEVQDLEAAGIGIIQIDEAALREGLPLRRSEWPEYLGWAIRAFRISANAVADATQIHTHMCYSEFNDIIEAIADMDADVITIETSRSNMELLDVFERFAYPNEIGPGVYDIHSPNIPSVEQMVALMEKAAERIPAERLWVNPDCGLKTRSWEEVLPALAHLVEAARILRQRQGSRVA